MKRLLETDRLRFVRRLEELVELPWTPGSWSETLAINTRAHAGSDQSGRRQRGMWPPKRRNQNGYCRDARHRAFDGQNYSAHQGRSVESLLADVEAAREAILRRPALDLGGTGYVVRDMRSCPVCDGRGGAIDTYDDGPCHQGPRGPIPELPEAACRDGVAYIAGPFDSPDGRRKYTCSEPAHVILAFLDRWAAKQGLLDLYCDPVRGFAGGYVVAAADRGAL